jgi:hypothetical protein
MLEGVFVRSLSYEENITLQLEEKMNLSENFNVV